MKCPLCETELVVTGQREFETLIEHCSDPNMEEYPLRDVYQCTNVDCLCFVNDMFWNDYGETYFNSPVLDQYKTMRDACPNLAPFGSYERQASVEIYKEGVRRYYKPMPIVFGRQLAILCEYEADMDGNILKRWYKLRFLRYR